MSSLLVIAASSMMLSAVGTFSSNENIAHAAYDPCEDIPVLTCEVEAISFRQYKGELVNISPEGYDPALVRSESVREFIQKIVNYALSFLGLVAILLIIYAGVMYLTAGGQTEQTDKAKKTIGYTAIGLILILGSYAIVNTILTGPFDGGDNIEGEIQGYASNGFNANTQAITDAVQEIVDGYRFYYKAFSSLDELKDDLEKASLTIEDDYEVNKALMLQYLSKAKSAFLEIKYSAPAFSGTSAYINEAVSDVERFIDEIKVQPEFVVKEKDGKEEVVANDILQGIWSDDVYDSMKNGGGEKNKLGLADLLEVVKKDFVGNSVLNMALLNETECANYSGLGILGNQACKIQEVKTSIGKLDVSTQVTSLSDLYSNIERYMDDLASQANNLNLGQDLIVTNQSLSDVVYSLDDYAKAIKDVQFVETKLVANQVEGGAPLVVRFNILNSVDPSGETISTDPAKKQIEWDLMGDGYPSQGDTDMECYEAGKSVRTEFSNYCIYREPGAYRARVKIHSSDPDTYGSGESSLDIRVREPELKLDIAVSAAGDTYHIKDYNENTGDLVEDRKYASITEKGVTINFDASRTEALPQQGNMQEYVWDFGNGETEKGATQTASYEVEGTYTVILEATSFDGKKATEIFNVIVGSPAARFSISPLGQKIIGQPITFDASKSASEAGGIKSYTWSIKKVSPSKAMKIGPTATSIELIPEGENKDKIFNYTFSRSGAYSVELKVIDEALKPATKEEIIIIDSQSPVAMIEIEIPDPTNPSEVHFDASKSYDPDGEFGDLDFSWGEFTEEDPAIITDVLDPNLQSYQKIVRFGETGDYEISLTVSEGTNTSTTTKTFTIDNTLDVSWENKDSTATLGDDGEVEIPFSFSSNSAVAYEIDFGDGETETGIFDKIGSTPVTIAGTNHTYRESGKFDVRVRVYDDEDNSNEIKRSIFIGGGDKPIAKIGVSVNGQELIDFDEPLTVSRSDMITFDASESKNLDGTAKDLKYQWDFGDTKTSSQKQAMHFYKELSPAEGFTAKLSIFDTDDTEITNSAELKISVVPEPPKFSSLQALPQAGQDLVTPVTVNLEVFGAEDPDGQVTQYRWWYYNVNDPEDILGIQITDAPYAILTVGTNGAEGEEKTYGFGVEITDNDNQTTSTDEELDVGQAPTLEVTNGANAAPIAKFNVDRTSVIAGETVNFSSASTDPDGELIKYVWDFEGDGFFNNAPTSLSTVSHTYSKKNLEGYNVKLKVIDDKYGEAVSNALPVYVDSNAEDPIAAFKAEAIGGKLVEFTNNSTADESVGMEIVEYIWDFDTNSQFDTADSDGDGNKDNDVDSTQETPIFEYDEFGTYQIKLIVKDTHGNENTVTNTITVLGSSSTSTPGGTNPDGTTPGSFGMPPQGGDTDPGTGGGLDDEPGANTGGALGGQGADLQAVILTSPLPDSDGVIKLSGESETVTFDFSNSVGDIAYYIFDKNIYYDTNQNDIPNDEEDFKTSLPGVWTTNFEKAWGQIVVKLTVIDIYGNKSSTVQEIQFN